MAFKALQPLHLGTVGRLGLWCRLALLTLLSAIAATSAQAQVVVGGTGAPSVSVDLTVLDRLGPAPTLPQLFGARPGDAGAAPAQTRPTAPMLHRTSTTKSASLAKKKTRTHRVARHKTRSRTRLAHAPAPRQVVAPASQSVVRLTPPPKAPASQAAQSESVQPAAPAPSVRNAAAIKMTAPPAAPPMPPSPQAAEIPTAPVVATSRPPDEVPAATPAPQSPAHEEPAVSMMATQASSAEPPAPAPAPEPPRLAPAAPEKVAAPPEQPRPAPPIQVASAAAVATAPSAVKFAPGAADLPPSAQAILDNTAARLLANDALRIQLVAHATGASDQAMEARRVSLARAVAVRAYLIDKGVRSLRMDVRALGNRADDGPVNDQVDLVIVSQ